MEKEKKNLNKAKETVSKTLDAARKRFDFPDMQFEDRVCEVDGKWVKGIPEGWKVFNGKTCIFCENENLKIICTLR